MNNWAKQLSALIDVSRQNLTLTLGIVAILWAVHIVNVALRYRLNYFGIIPRRVAGLPGVIFAPFLHANFSHLLFNSIPLFLLINLMLLYGQTAFIEATLIIVIGGGLATWLLGRKAIHIGASGVIMGYWGFLLFKAYLNPNLIAVFTGVLCLYYLSGLFLQIVPSDKGVSWESHLYGLIAGLAAAYFIYTPII